MLFYSIYRFIRFVLCPVQNTTVPLTVLSEQVKENNNEPTQQKQTVTKEDEDFIDKLNKLINDNMAGEELSIKFLTDNMAMSRASLYHKVKTLTGLGVNDYINRLRIEKSVYLLTNTNLNINDFACKLLTLSFVWAPVAESAMIAAYEPVWNAHVTGFGNHAQGKGRSTGMQTLWDTLHPGRLMNGTPNIRTAQEIADEAEQALEETWQRKFRQ